MDNERIEERERERRASAHL